ncbi:unnamed protein product [Fusarium graminearum]|uniref:Uncharacterized protein n=1 Tax=Gibberella zeae TaxID=5518 RepID=A0A2H3FIX0_GIBZA|nr:hypothetical protein HG531_013717 [Fusarium graminearum]PCD18576.1 hypothetical protein FGRA07_06329 [Fusarium graminearum]CAF3521039.1 unnamed protein product [Fusarium graminearum]CAF3557660.1 unnamed protein product [Fusarium graminearum]CAG1972692.1 unnamed protein product [Fusarium graminearum]
MAALVPFPESGISATYSPCSKTLLLEAKGKVPGYLAGAFIQREDWVGGLRFSLRAFPLLYPQDFPPPSPKQIDATLKVPIQLPLSWLNSKTVLFETATAVYNITIKYLLEGVGPADPPKNGLTSSNGQANGQDTAQTDEQTDGGRIIGSVLPPIKVPLTGGVTHNISARVPASQGGAIVPLPTVKISFDSEFIKLVDAYYAGDSIFWTISWEKLPTEEGKNPQSVDVTTSIPHTQFGGLTSWTRIVQPYTVEFYVLEK